VGVNVSLKDYLVPSPPSHPALHTERVQHAAVGVMLDPVEELDHRLLEKDLSLQLQLLRDELKTVTPYMFEKSAVDAATPGGIATVAANPVAEPIHHHHSEHTMKDYIEQGEELFLMPNGLADAFAFGMALLILSIAPFIFSS